MVKYHELPSFIFPCSLVFSWEKKKWEGKVGRKGGKYNKLPTAFPPLLFFPDPLFSPWRGKVGRKGECCIPTSLILPWFLVIFLRRDKPSHKAHPQ